MPAGAPRRPTEVFGEKFFEESLRGTFFQKSSSQNKVMIVYELM
jgi:hypothetical protein